MKILDRILGTVGFVCLATAVLASPWFFGAWEMWWFWVFAVLLFSSTFFFGCRVALDPGRVVGRGRGRVSARPILLGYAVFLAYALVRFLQADVFMDAERSFLLFVTPFLIGLQVVFGLDARRRGLLFGLMAANFFALGGYGVINHLVTGSARVMWAPGFPQYVQASRATGSYYCPDHFAGIMELAFGMALALVLDRRSSRGWRAGGAVLGALAAAGVVMSKSRGGGLTLLVMGVAALCWGFSQWPRAVRWNLRGAVALAAVAGLIVFWSLEGAYVQRFRSYFGVSELQEMPASERLDAFSARMRATSRGRMISGALRAWRTQPVWGIGPGMHQNVWPHFAASADGDRERGIWPSMPNHDFHSYEVHSDWVQLLQEYGVAGFLLFLLPAGLLWRALVRLRPQAERTDAVVQARGALHAAALTALLGLVGMGFHSLGDFNLQMPATVWMLAALLALPFEAGQGPARNAGRTDGK